MLLGALLGIVLGGSQALSRSLFSQLIPKGKEGEYFGLYEISDKGTSWLGPLLFGLAYQATGRYDIAIISLITFFVIGFVALLAIPMRRAIVAAGNTRRPPPRADLIDRDRRRSASQLHDRGGMGKTGAWRATCNRCPTCPTCTPTTPCCAPGSAGCSATTVSPLAEGPLKALAAEVTGPLRAAHTDAESHPPVLHRYDGWGARVDRVEVSAGWERLRVAAAEHGVVALPYLPEARQRWGAGARVVQHALLHLYGPESATFTCPVAMADGAAALLSRSDVDARVREAWLPRLVSTDPRTPSPVDSG